MKDPLAPNRRKFLSGTAAGTLASTIAAGSVGVHSETAAAQTTPSLGDSVRIGLVGAGGRGGGAIQDSMSINDNVVITAMADLDLKRAGLLKKAVERKFEDKVQVKSSAMYEGLDGYKRILDDQDIDLVFFTTPPGFRPGHISEAVDAGKHVFAEKPTCVDPHGYRVCVEADKKARENKTAIVTGTQYRRQTSFIEAINRLQAGIIGDIISATSRYCSNGIWFKPRRDGMADTEYQIFNWMHYIWLSGDQIAEQAVHNIDAMNWLMGGPPENAFAVGGRFTRPDDSEMWDSMAVDYAYPGNRMISFMCRQIPNAKSENGTIVYCQNGTAEINGFNSGSVIRDKDGNEVWKMEGDIGAAYQQEHKDLVDSIRSGNPIVELKQTAQSSLTAVMGRLAAYTGQKVDWEFLTEKSKLNLWPETVDPKADREINHAVPGTTKLI